MAAASWVRWRAELEKACDGTHWTIERIEQGLGTGQYRLLETPDACFIAEIVGYPGERACQLLFTAGTLDAVTGASADVEAWAKLMGCTEMLIEGNPAWPRVLKPLGYEVWSVTVRKAL